MQNSMIDIITICVMDRELKIRCPKDKTTELKEAAKYLDNKMREIYQANKLVTIDRVAITAALNIVYELMIAKQQSQLDNGDLNKRINNLKNKLSIIGSSS
jgi:cell division protein ZapA